MEPQQQHMGDLTATTARTLIWWGPGILLIVFTANLAGMIRPAAWTAGLLWMAGLCLWNLRRCGWVHCMFTGPFFLAMAVVAALAGAGIFSFGAEAWTVLGFAILAGGIALCCVPEMIFGRYWSSGETTRNRSAHSQSARKPADGSTSISAHKNPLDRGGHERGRARDRDQFVVGRRQHLEQWRRPLGDH
jgi:hypothetical protein